MGDGPPSGDLHSIRTNTGGGDLGTADIAWEFSSQYEGRPPVLSLDKELLERSVFLDQVNVDDQFDQHRLG